MRSADNRAVKQRSGMRWDAILLICVVTLGAGVGIGLKLVPAPVPALLVAADEPSQATVASQDYADNRPVTATLVPGIDIELRLRIQGTIVWMSQTSPAPMLTSGSTIMVVDSTPVIALATSMPMYRDFSNGDKGEDVLSFSRELVRLGFLEEEGSTFTWSMGQAWIALQNNTGIAEPEDTMRVDALVWIPKPEVRANQWRASIGSATPLDQILGIVSGDLVSIDVALVVPGDLLPGPRIFSLFGQEITIDELGTVSDPDYLHSVQSCSEYINILTTSTDLRASGEIRLATPIQALRVPPSAVFGMNEQSGCVLSNGSAVRVIVIGSSLGSSLIVADEAIKVVSIGQSVASTVCPD